MVFSKRKSIAYKLKVLVYFFAFLDIDILQ